MNEPFSTGRARWRNAQRLYERPVNGTGGALNPGVNVTSMALSFVQRNPSRRFPGLHKTPTPQGFARTAAPFEPPAGPAPFPPAERAGYRGARLGDVTPGNRRRRCVRGRVTGSRRSAGSSVSGNEKRSGTNRIWERVTGSKPPLRFERGAGGPVSCETVSERRVYTGTETTEVNVCRDKEPVVTAVCG